MRQPSSSSSCFTSCCGSHQLPPLNAEAEAPALPSLIQALNTVAMACGMAWHSSGLTIYKNKCVYQGTIKLQPMKERTSKA